MMISECNVGSDIRVVGVDLDERQIHRMRELGLGSGARARVVQRAAFGGRILAILGQRIAIDAGTARRITVELLPAAAPAAAPAKAAAVGSSLPAPA